MKACPVRKVAIFACAILPFSIVIRNSSELITISTGVVASVPTRSAHSPPKKVEACADLFHLPLLPSRILVLP